MSPHTVIRHATLAPMTDLADWALIPDGALVVEQGRIAWMGPNAELPALWQDSPCLDAQGQVLTPALVEAHTHLVHAGERSLEFEMRLQGRSYVDIAQAGGGIMSTVRATRGASEDELVKLALSRAQALLREGVATLEIKSGYGLDLETEARMLRAATRLGALTGQRISRTFLGAHALPPEFAGRADDYIAHLCQDMLPALHQEGLVDAVDAFCEGIGFSPAQTRRLFEAARALGLPVKLHADQLSDLGGAGLVAEFGGWSADHIEFTSEDSLAAMAKAGTVAMLLPGAFYTLRETQLPPIEGLRRHGIAMALSTDSNPGTSPTTSLLLMLHMAATLFRLTPLEAMLGVTRHAAQALGMTQAGRLAVGAPADLALWQVAHPRELVYAFGQNRLSHLWRDGRPLVAPL